MLEDLAIILGASTSEYVVPSPMAFSLKGERKSAQWLKPIPVWQNYVQTDGHAHDFINLGVDHDMQGGVHRDVTVCVEEPPVNLLGDSFKSVSLIQ